MARPGCCLLAAEADRERMDLGAEAGGRAQGAKLKGNLLLVCWLTCSLSRGSASAPSGPMVATEGHAARGDGDSHLGIGDGDTRCFPRTSARSGVIQEMVSQSERSIGDRWSGAA